MIIRGTGTEADPFVDVLNTRPDFPTTTQFKAWVASQPTPWVPKCQVCGRDVRLSFHFNDIQVGALVQFLKTSDDMNRLGTDWYTSARWSVRPIMQKMRACPDCNWAYTKEVGRVGNANAAASAATLANVLRGVIPAGVQFSWPGTRVPFLDISDAIEAFVRRQGVPLE